MRAIAAEARVDAELISYFFGSKRGLFAASLALSASPPEFLLRALAGDPESLPERVLRALLTTWDDPHHGRSLRTVVEAAIRVPEVGRLLQEMIEQEMIDRLADQLRGPDARSRAAAFTAQLGGLIFTRYILRVHPLATMSTDEIVQHCAPGLRATLRNRWMNPPPRQRVKSKPPCGACSYRRRKESSGFRAVWVLAR